MVSITWSLQYHFLSLIPFFIIFSNSFIIVPIAEKIIFYKTITEFYKESRTAKKWYCKDHVTDLAIYWVEMKEMRNLKKIFANSFAKVA